jgi:hypothetical protein
VGKHSVGDLTRLSVAGGTAAPLQPHDELLGPKLVGRVLLPLALLPEVAEDGRLCAGRGWAWSR